MDDPGGKRYLAREQIELTKLMAEIENSVSVVKEQINALTVSFGRPWLGETPFLPFILFQVETLHLKYLMITKNKTDSDIRNTANRPKAPNLDLSIKAEPHTLKQDEEMDSD